MEKPLLAGILLVAGAMASIGAVAGFVAASRPLYAEVVSVEPLARAVSVQKQECQDIRASRQASVKERLRLAGTAIGGMVGGAISYQYGEPGGGRATALGATADTFARGSPHKVAQKQEDNPLAAARCRIVNRTEQQVYAYDVRYRLDGRLGKVRLYYEPGKRIPVRAGQLLGSEGHRGHEEIPKS